MPLLGPVPGPYKPSPHGPAIPPGMYLPALGPPFRTPAPPLPSGVRTPNPSPAALYPPMSLPSQAPLPPPVSCAALFGSSPPFPPSQLPYADPSLDRRFPAVLISAEDLTTSLFGYHRSESGGGRGHAFSGLKASQLSYGELEVVLVLSLGENKIQTIQV